MAKFVFLAFSLVCLHIATGSSLTCYQCTDSVIKPCKLTEAGQATCSNDPNSACALEVPENAATKDVAIRKCVILNSAGDYKCNPGFQCSHCKKDMCNSPAPQIIPLSYLSFVVLTGLAAYLV